MLTPLFLSDLAPPMDIDAQIDSSSYTLTCEVEGAHRGQAECGRAEIGTLPVWMF